MRASQRPEADSADLIGLLGKRLDDDGVRDFLVQLNRGSEPYAHVLGNALIGESRTYFFPSAGVIVCATDYSGAGPRIASVTMVGTARRVYRDGREYAVEPFRGSLPLPLKWGDSRAAILERLGPPSNSNAGISISDRPKTPIHESRDADEFQQGAVIVRLVYAGPFEDPGAALDEIQLQRTTGPGRP